MKAVASNLTRKAEDYHESEWFSDGDSGNCCRNIGSMFPRPAAMDPRDRSHRGWSPGHPQKVTLLLYALLNLTPFFPMLAIF